MNGRRLLLGAMLGAALVPANEAAPQVRRRGRSENQVLAQEFHRQGRELMRSEAYADAIEKLGEAVRLDPLLVMAHYDLGQAQVATKDFAAAIRAYLACRQAYLDLAADLVKNTLEAQQARDDRVRDLRDRIRELQGIRPAPNTSQASMIQIEMQRTENLIASLERLRDQQPRDIEVPAEFSLALGSAYLRSDRLEDAEREYQAALAVRPRFGEARSNLAVVYLLGGRPAEAMQQVELAEKAGFKVAAGLKKDIEKALEAAKQ